MPFSEKLDTLMQVFGISNSRLAAGIRVDASLISRWRNGERNVDAKSPHIAAIAGYFIRLANMEYQKYALSEITGINLGCESSDNKIKFISQWLCGELHQPNTLSARIESLISNVGSRIAGRESPDIVIPGSQPSAAHPCNTEVFSGTQSKREAFNKFLRIVLAAEDPCEILFLCEENMSWLVSDKDYCIEWGNILSKIISKGCRIKVIHNVNRNLSELISLIERWLPMQLSGRLESYYYPRRRENPFKRTMLIATGLAALTSTSVGRSGDGSALFLFRDAQVIDIFEQDFRSYLFECSELIRLFSSGSAEEYASIVAEFDGQYADCVCYKDGPSDITMPDSLFERLLSGAHLPDAKKAKIVQQNRTKSVEFLNSLKYNVYTEAVRLPALSELSEGFSHIVMTDKPEISQQIRYDRTALIEHLQNVVYLLRNYENYNFVHIKEPLIKDEDLLSLSVKSETGAIISKGQFNRPNFTAIAANEPNITDALYSYLSDVVERMPMQRRENASAADMLTDYIERVRQLDIKQPAPQNVSARLV